MPYAGYRNHRSNCFCGRTDPFFGFGPFAIGAQRGRNLIIAGFLSIWGRHGTKMWSENVRTVRDFFQMYMRPKAEQYFRGEMFVNLKISTITGVFYSFYLRPTTTNSTRNVLFGRKRT